MFDIKMTEFFIHSRYNHFWLLLAPFFLLGPFYSLLSTFSWSQAPSESYTVELHSKGFHRTSLIFAIDWNSHIANKEIDRKITKGILNHFPYWRISLPGGSLGARFHCSCWLLWLLMLLRLRWGDKIFYRELSLFWDIESKKVSKWSMISDFD